MNSSLKEQRRMRQETCPGPHCVFPADVELPGLEQASSPPQGLGGSGGPTQGRGAAMVKVPEPSSAWYPGCLVSKCRNEGMGGVDGQMGDMGAEDQGSQVVLMLQSWR